jgi:uncharacterized protein YbaP (TraB family)
MKRNTTILYALLALLVNLPCFGQQNNNSKDTRVVCKVKLPDIDKSLLWQISGNGLTKPSYLFGTIHLICKDDYLWTDKMKEALDKSQKVCFEMNLHDPAVMMQVATAMIDTSGKSLKDYYTPEQYRMVVDYFMDTIGMSLAMFQKLKPVGLQTFLSTRESGCANPQSYEENIMDAALIDKKEILGLESPQEQMAVLESIPVDTVVKQLLDDIQDKNKDKSEYNKMIAAYKSQDLPVLYNLILSSKDLSDNMDAFLKDRNNKWIPRMQDKMKKSSVFFAVGAGHLYGPDGVINLLRKAGYTVTTLK